MATRCINSQTLFREEDEMEVDQTNSGLGSGVVMITLRIIDLDSGTCLLSFQ